MLKPTYITVNYTEHFHVPRYKIQKSMGLYKTPAAQRARRSLGYTVCFHVHMWMGCKSVMTSPRYCSVTDTNTQRNKHHHATPHTTIPHYTPHHTLPSPHTTIHHLITHTHKGISTAPGETIVPDRPTSSGQLWTVGGGHLEVLVIARVLEHS